MGNHEQEELLERIQNLIEMEEFFTSFVQDSPIPAWYKEHVHGEFRMRFVNHAYTSHTGISLKSYQGMLDRNLWSDSISKEFNNGDMAAVHTRSKVFIAEPTIINGHSIVWVGHKWPEIKYSKVIGVWGQATPMAEATWQSIKHLPPFNVELFK